jgi:hypothetical protein
MSSSDEYLEIRPCQSSFCHGDVKVEVNVWICGWELKPKYARAHLFRNNSTSARHELRHRSHPSIEHTIFLYQALIELRCCRLVLQPSTMVVLVDLDDEAPSPQAARAPGFIRDMKPVHHSFAPAVTEDDDSARAPDERPNPNINGFSAALSCYP